MTLKDNNFISAVVYLHNDGARAVEFCRTVAAELDANFKQYELVVVDDACTDDTVKQLRAWGREQDAPLTILHMSIYHGLEGAMNAGLDAAIGDYVYEFDSTELCYAPTLIMQAYRAALDGSDPFARAALVQSPSPPCQPGRPFDRRAQAGRFRLRAGVARRRRRPRAVRCVRGWPRPIPGRPLG